MDHPEEATEAHRQDVEYYITDEQIEQALADCVELENESISVDSFAHDEVAGYMFGSCAKEYGEFLRDAGIKEMPIFIDEWTDRPFVRQMWFNGLCEWSEIVCGGLDLSCGQGVRGIAASTGYFTNKYKACARNGFEDIFESGLSVLVKRKWDHREKLSIPL